MEQGRGAGRGVAGGGGVRSRGGPCACGRAASRPAGRSSPGREEGVRRRRGGGRPAAAGRRASGGQELDLQGANGSHAGILGLIHAARPPGRAIARDSSRPRPRPPKFPRPARASAYAPPSALQRRLDAA